MNKIIIIFLFLILFFERIFYTLSLKEPKGEIVDKIIGKVAVFSYLLIVFVGFKEVFSKNNNFIFLIVGLIIICLGIFLRRWSIKELGKNWSLYVRDIDNQQYIKTGPYKYLKHPYYIAVSFELLGIILIFQSIIALFLFTFLHMPLIIYRISIEEKLLRKKFRDY